MRIDHHAFQRATRVAGAGLLIQLGLGLALLFFGLIAKDTAFVFGSLYVLLGLLVWLGLMVIFNQQKLERLEALEQDELSQHRGGDASMFDAADDETHVAARRLRLMHKWLMPGLSLLIAAALGFVAWRQIRHLGMVADENAEFLRTSHIGWAVAICLSFTALSFIVSRFVAGMSRQPAWQNLRGGAAFMVGNSLVTLGIAIGIGFRFFKNEAVIETIATAIPIFMAVVAVEIVANFVLNLYRPRVPGEVPRPAFDSKLLSLLSAPDNLVRSINEAVNYQFGFDVTSSWGYQLLLRSFAWLLGLGLLMLVLLNMLVIVEPSQQAVKLSFGAQVGREWYTSGVMWKLPWPFQTAQIHDVSRLRRLHLTSRQVRFEQPAELWTDDLGQKFDRPLDPFIVRSSDLGTMDIAAPDVAVDDPEAAELAAMISLVDAEITVQWRIREDGGLIDYLRFHEPAERRADRESGRERALRGLALREVGRYFADLSLREVLAENRPGLGEELRDRIQVAFDQASTGVEAAGVNVLLLRPAAAAASSGKYEELSIGIQARQEHVAQAEQQVVTGFAQLVGDPANAAPILAEIETLHRLRDGLPAGVAASPETIVRRDKVERMIVEAGGEAARQIMGAGRDRWARIMEARGQASRARGQLEPYRAAPRLYRQRETMIVYSQMLGGLRKYVLGIDPARVNFGLELKELNPLFNISDAIENPEGGAGQ